MPEAHFLVTTGNQKVITAIRYYFLRLYILSIQITTNPAMINGHTFTKAIRKYNRLFHPFFSPALKRSPEKIPPEVFS